MYYLIKSPGWFKSIFPNMIWEAATQKNEMFLTFDDGPHPVHTPFVLNILKQYNAKATFFCIGKNVVQYPHIYQQIIDEGHAIGNHTYNHVNGYVVKDEMYLKEVNDAADIIKSNLFRPPYGRIKRFQAKVLTTLQKPYKIIMWTVLSGDFDTSITKETCAENVLLKATNGAIIVFHDSDKAAERMYYALPKVLQYFTDKGYVFEKITELITNRTCLK